MDRNFVERSDFNVDTKDILDVYLPSGWNEAIVRKKPGQEACQCGHFCFTVAVVDALLCGRLLERIR